MHLYIYNELWKIHLSTGELLAHWAAEFAQLQQSLEVDYPAINGATAPEGWEPPGHLSLWRLVNAKLAEPLRARLGAPDPSNNPFPEEAPLQALLDLLDVSLPFDRTVESQIVAIPVAIWSSQNIDKRETQLRRLKGLVPERLRQLRVAIDELERSLIDFQGHPFAGTIENLVSSRISLIERKGIQALQDDWGVGGVLAQLRRGDGGWPRLMGNEMANRILRNIEQVNGALGHLTSLLTQSLYIDSPTGDSSIVDEYMSLDEMEAWARSPVEPPRAASFTLHWRNRA